MDIWHEIRAKGKNRHWNKPLWPFKVWQVDPRDIVRCNVDKADVYFFTSTGLGTFKSAYNWSLWGLIWGSGSVLIYSIRTLEHIHHRNNSRENHLPVSARNDFNSLHHVHVLVRLLRDGKLSKQLVGSFNSNLFTVLARVHLRGVCMTYSWECMHKIG